MTIHFSGFAQFLLTRKLITSDDLEQLISYTKKHNVTFIKSILDCKYLDERETAKISAEYFHHDFLDFDHLNVDESFLNLLPKDFIWKNKVLPIFEINNILHLAIYDPTDISFLSTLKFHLTKEIKFIIVEYSKLNNFLQKTFTAIKGDFEKQDKSIISLVDNILNSAIKENASDIHLEPFVDEFRIRFRIDGLLYKRMSLPLTVANQVISRLKVMSNLDIAEKRLPQDGRFSFSCHEKNIRDCRISNIPVTYGEKIAIRLLNPRIDVLQLANLGLEDMQKDIFLKYLSLPQGMIVVTGPTGSGKTQTLLTAINMLNTENRNIFTAENPIEIVLSGINQVEVNQKIGLTFANVLRAFLRQDPDVIMIGEIRDLETAEIATKAAETGHLVFSSLHTNTAAEAIVRFRNMGINIFNLSNSINLIIAQRLIRKLCPFCKQNIVINDFIKQIFHDISLFDINSVIYKACSCNKCEGGYKGRIGVFELLPISENIRLMIMQGKSAIEIFTKASFDGMLSLRNSALMKVLQGVTSLEEVSRVIGL